MNYTLKNKVIKFIANYKGSIHSKTALIRLAIVRTAPTRYGKMVAIGRHTYVSKWSKSHTSEGIHVRASRGLVGGVKTFYSYGSN